MSLTQHYISTSNISFSLTYQFEELFFDIIGYHTFRMISATVIDISIVLHWTDALISNKWSHEKQLLVWKFPNMAQVIIIKTYMQWKNKSKIGTLPSSARCTLLFLLLLKIFSHREIEFLSNIFLFDRSANEIALAIKPRRIARTFKMQWLLDNN